MALTYGFTLTLSCIQTDNTCKALITVQGRRQAVGQLLHQLLLADFGKCVWANVESLCSNVRYNISNSRANTTAEQEPMAVKALNGVLSQALLSLRKNEYFMPYSKAIYKC
ncbi:hypothetical protein GGI14_003126, partial [Coemansia sp. S680]